MPISLEDRARLDILLREAQETRDAADAAILGARQTVREARRLVADSAEPPVAGTASPTRRWVESQAG